MSQAEEIRRLRSALNEIHSWLVCSAIASAEDMAQSFDHMESVARAALSNTVQQTRTSENALLPGVPESCTSDVQAFGPDQHPDAKVYIYSGEHGLFWRANAAGYTNRREEAGRYTREEAERYAHGCGPEKMIRIVPIEPQAQTNEAEAKNVIAPGSEK